MDKEQYECLTKRITVSGIVQGVGFRPLVYHIAQKYNIKGTVRNIGGLVEIITQSSKQNFDDFLYALKNSDFDIVSIDIEDINYLNFNDFKIINSSSNDEVSIIPPDLPVCPSCQKELYSDDDRRFLNPFISCMSCGARYTIIDQLPYDRHNTTMLDFEMCDECKQEYTSSSSRRFHAQTISCNDCGPYLILNDLIDKEAFNKAVSIIKADGIIAVKGIGGYHFACTPFNEDTVQNLRKLKGREEKPFAVMFSDINSVKEYCKVSAEEEELLKSRAHPIVLLYTNENVMAESTNKNSIYCGSFLPYTPLQMILTKECGPLIMTSANISNQPIIKDDEKILALSSPLLGGVLYNKRRIVRSVDDSVARVIDNQPQIIRRSRGYVPYPIFLPKIEKRIFAAGGDLKAAYSLYNNGNAVVSQYFGDLEEQIIFDEYKYSFRDLSNLLKIEPDVAVCDLHPNYHSRKYAQSLGIPVTYVQHHHAHVASVMAEHNLKEKVIGIAFDGTGYGTDGNIWGGEFLICEGAEFERAAHMAYTPIIGGDSSMRDAKKTATCFLVNCGLDEYITDDRKDIISKAIKGKINTVLTSSMGRLFDAVSSILDIKNENTYEGECATNLEREAVLALRMNKKPSKMAFAFSQKKGIIEVDAKPVLAAICKLRECEEKGAIALGFHYCVAELMLQICTKIRVAKGIHSVALCGGVMQNAVLMLHALKLLKSSGFNVYYNQLVPPNDGAISLGQTYLEIMR